MHVFKKVSTSKNVRICDCYTCNTSKKILVLQPSLTPNWHTELLHLLHLVYKLIALRCVTKNNGGMARKNECFSVKISMFY